MLPFKKILCPTDFSEPSCEAIKKAGEIAFQFGSELCILHVVSTVPVVPIGEPSDFNVPLYEQYLASSSTKSLQEIINQLEWKDLKVRLIVLKGIAYDEIVRITEEENVDLIVIATRGRTGMDRLIFGSVAEKVVRFGRCPVLTIAIKATSQEGAETLKRREVSALSGRKGVGLPKVPIEMKEAYQRKVETQMKEWGIKIEELKAKAGGSKAELKRRFEKQVEDLRTDQAVLERKLSELKESGEEAWEQMKIGIENNLNQFRDSIDRTLSVFKEKREDVAETITQKKKVYVEKAEVQLKEYERQIRLLKAKAEKTKVEAKITYLKQIKELRSKEAALRQKVSELKESGDEAWEDFRKGLEHAVSDMKGALKQSASRFKKN